MKLKRKVKLKGHCGIFFNGIYRNLPDDVSLPSFVSSYTEAHPHRVEGMNHANEIEEESEH